MPARRTTAAPPARPGRRLALGGIAAGAVLLAGCGFELRRPLAFPFQRIALAGFAAASPLEAELRRALQAAGVTLSPTPDTAQVVLRALQDLRERSVAASTAAGQVRELQLRLLVSVRADTPQGRALMPPVSLRLTRDLSTTESATLAKRLEEVELYREMQSDVVDQLLRRLAALDL